jgi:hypothetical protein
VSGEPRREGTSTNAGAEVGFGERDVECAAAVIDVGAATGSDDPDTHCGGCGRPGDRDAGLGGFARGEGRLSQP